MRKQKIKIDIEVIKDGGSIYYLMSKITGMIDEGEVTFGILHDTDSIIKWEIMND